MSFELDPKVRVNVPEFLNEIIAGDVESFAIAKNRLCNEIFRYYGDKKLKLDSDISLENYKVLQFTLNQDNLDYFAAICDSIKIDNKAEYFRKLLYVYCNQPRFMREQVIYFSSCILIKEAIHFKQKLKIRYKDEYRIIEPYALIKSDGETRNYILCYCTKRQEYAIYRLAHIKAVSILRDQLYDYYDEEYVTGLRNNFDAFLSYGKHIKVRLSQSGIKMYQKNITHRPKLIEQENDVYTFECSALKAQLYFPQFMNNAEILEPIELRTWFKDKYTEVAELYK